MKPLLDYSTLRHGLFHWQGYEPAVKCDCSSTAIVTAAGLIFIDPIPLAQQVLIELITESFSAPAAVVLTSGNHQRESLDLGKKLGAPIFAPMDAGADIVADQRFLAGDPVAGMQSIALPGFASGETAFLYGGVLIVGDALINLGAEGLSILPDKYCLDKQAAHRSLALLKDLHPEVICFAHGYPMIQDTSAKLESLLGALRPHQ